jgi:hypothetical protein
MSAPGTSLGPPESNSHYSNFTPIYIVVFQIASVIVTIQSLLSASSVVYHDFVVFWSTQQ